MFEYAPKWLQKQRKLNGSIREGDKHLSFSTAKNIVETDHKNDLNSVFMMLHKSVKGRILRLIKA